MTRLQPRSVGQLIDGGFEVLRFRFTTIATVSLAIALPLVIVPAAIVAWAGATSTERTAFTPAGGLNTLNDGGIDLSGGLAVVFFVSVFGGLLSQMLLGVGLGHLIAGWLGGEDFTPRQTLRFVIRKLPVAALALVLVTLLKAASAIICGIGLLWTIPLFAVLGPLVAVEGLGAVPSLQRCYALSKPRGTALLGMCVAWVLVGWLVQGAGLVLTEVLKLYVSDAGKFVDTLVDSFELALGVMVSVVQACVATLFYVDLRVRREGLDLSLDIDELFGPQSYPGGPY